MQEKQPSDLSPDTALRIVRELAADSDRIVVLDHASKRMAKRRITRRQVEMCLRKGTVVEGPFINPKGNWQVTLFRHAAGEELKCAVAIEWSHTLLVVTVFV